MGASVGWTSEVQLFRYRPIKETPEGFIQKELGGVSAFLAVYISQRGLAQASVLSRMVQVEWSQNDLEQRFLLNGYVLFIPQAFTTWSRKGLCRNPMGFFSEFISGQFEGHFRVDFSGAFSLERKENTHTHTHTHTHTKESTAKFKSNFGGLAAASHCKDLALIPSCSPVSF